MGILGLLFSKTYSVDTNLNVYIHIKATIFDLIIYVYTYVYI